MSPTLEEFIFQHFNEKYPDEMREVLADYDKKYPRKKTSITDLDC